MQGTRFNPWSENQIPHAATKSLQLKIPCAASKTWCSQILKKKKEGMQGNCSLEAKGNKLLVDRTQLEQPNKY